MFFRYAVCVRLNGVEKEKMSLFDILNLIGGLSLFLFGMTLMG